jgi:hypothetical protein
MLVLSLSKFDPLNAASGHGVLLPAVSLLGGYR